MVKGLKKKNNNFSDLEDINSQNSQSTQSYQIMDVPLDGSCLFWASALSYLSELKAGDDDDDDIKFRLACKRLFGEISLAKENTVKRLINGFLKKPKELVFIYRSTVFQELITVFRRRVVDYIEQQREEFREFIIGNFASYLQSMRLVGCFGGELEIRAMVKLLACDIKIIDIEQDLTVLRRFDSVNELNIPEQANEPLIQIRTLHLFYYANKLYYCFGLLFATDFTDNCIDIKNDDLSNKRNNTELNSESELESSGSDYGSDSESTLFPSKISQRKNLPVFSNRVSKPINSNQVILSYMIKGISIGVFLETVLLVFPASPLVWSFYNEEIRKFSLVEFLQAPYSYYQTYQLFLLRPTPFDTLLSNFLDIKKTFATGILVGAGGGLIKALIDTDNMHQVLLMSAVVFSVIPANYFLNEQMERMQMIFRICLTILLSGYGLVNTVNFTLFYLKKIPEVAKSITKNISKRIPSFSFFLPKKNEKPEETAMDSEAYFQSDIRASL